MDAMDITNLPIPPVQRESKQEYKVTVDEAIDSTSHENENISFEELISSVFGEVMQAKDEVSSDMLEVSNLESNFLLGEEINVDEDVNSFITNVLQGKEVLANEIMDDKTLLPSLEIEGFEEIEKDIPVIECELELSSSKIKDKKSTKNVKQDCIEEKEEKGEEIVEVIPKEENKHVVSLVKEKEKELQKVELKNDKKEDDVEKVSDNIVAQRPKKMAKKLNISVEDLRTTSETKVLESPITSGEGQMESFDGEPSFSDGKNVTASSENVSNYKTEINEGVGSNQFSSILAEQIKANSAELVQRGKIVLRNGNTGEIRLQLKPAHLGVVRINLKMTGDKKLKGEVTVSSKEAYNAFEDSMEDLVACFKDAGFDTSGFDLNWKGGKEEIVRENLRDKYFSPEKTELSLREKLNLTENIYMFGQAENINVLA